MIMQRMVRGWRGRRFRRVLREMQAAEMIQRNWKIILANRRLPKILQLKLLKDLAREQLKQRKAQKAAKQEEESSREKRRRERLEREKIKQEQQAARAESPQIPAGSTNPRGDPTSAAAREARFRLV